MHISINERNALKLLADAFSNRTTFLTELMQNARRAGASYVRFLLDSTSNTLLVEDDGCGVDDFGALLRLCESGWSEAVQESDAPYGVGFLSAIMASEHFEVTSKRGTLVADTDQLLAGQPAAVTSDTVVSGTRITLKLRHRIDRLGAQLADVAVGFPIDVYFNGTCMSRHVSTNNTPYTTEIPGVGVLTWTGHDGGVTTLLQGLPVRVESQSYSYNTAYNPQWGLHLDPHLYRGRMPDREVVLDLVWEDIKGAIYTAQDELITHAFKQSGGAPSKALYVLVASRPGTRHLIQEVTVIPPGIFSYLHSAPDEIDTLCRPARAWLSRHDESVTRDSDFKYVRSCTLDNGDEIAAMRVLHDNGTLVTGCALPAWAEAHVLNWYEVEIVTTNTPIIRTISVGSYGRMDVCQCDSVTVRLLDDEGNLLLETVEDDFCPLIDGTLYLTNNTTRPSWSFFQQDDTLWDGDRDQWDDDAIQHCVDVFTRELELALGSDPVELVVAACNEANRTELYGKRYTVLFTPRGAAVVDASAADQKFSEAVALLEQVLRNRDVPDSLADAITALLVEVPRGQA
ncbi:MAG TPA: hypothetical protein PLL72_00515 [Burkholderiaceae bacterium]|nr:hypothetical protein [Burkholderiaceae bacterium]